MKHEQTSLHDLDLLREYFAGLERQGPGNPESTVKAVSFIDNFSDEFKTG